MESRMEAYLNAAISGNTENLPKPISRIDFLLCELIKTLGESGASIEEVEKIVTDKVAEIVADAPKDFDTLKELSDWIYTHEESAAEMNSAIQTNTNSIESLMTDVNKKANSNDVYDKATADSRFLGIDATADKAVADENGSNISETFSTMKNDIAINRTTLGTQCKNLLKNTAVTKTVNGVTFTVNDDSTITANGTATSRIIFLVGTAYISQTGNYTYTGTPSGGASSTYSMNYRDRSSVYKTVETGSGITARFEGGKTYEAVIDIRSGVTVSNLTFYPMLRYADIVDDTYEPYSDSIDERLIEDKSNIAINKTTLGYRCKNLLKNTASTTTVNNVTFTVNSDGSITAKQTTTAPGNATIDIATNITLNPGTYILTGDDEIKKFGYGEIRFYINGTIYTANTAHTFDEEVTISAVRIFIWSGVNINGSKTIYPMLRYADITDSTYEPYKESVDKRLINNTSDIAINHTTIGYQCKNLLKPISGTTRAGITYTVNEDGSVTLTGASTTGSTYNYFSIPITLKPGKYKVNGMPETSKTTTYRTDLRATESGGTTYGYGVKEFEVEFTKTTTAYYMIRIDGSYKESLNGITFYPMIRYADIIDDTYEPYSDSVDERILENKSDIVINKTTLGYQRKNLFNETEYLSSIASVSIGTFNISGNSIILTATGKDCYTKPHASGDGGYRIPVTPDTDYILSWESDNSNDGYVYAFMNGSLSQQKLANNKDTKYFKFTTNSNTTFITIRLGVSNSGESITYSNIMLRYADILDNTYEPYLPSLQEQIVALEARIAALEV